MTTATTTAAGIIAEDLMIPSDTPGIDLHVRRKRPAGRAAFDAARTVLLMHGATYGGGSLFDVPFAGVSFMDWLASAGYDVYAVDARGYGGSTRPAEMAAPPARHAPIVRTATAVADLATAAAHVRRARGLTHTALIGMSWGGTVAGAYTAAHPDAVSKLVLVAPQWLADAARIDPGGDLGAWRRVPVAAGRARWLDAAPPEARATLLPDGWFEQWAAATLADDPVGAAEDPPILRVAAGAVLDVREYWTAGRPFYDPSAIRAPVLLVHAEWDADVTLDRTAALFARLTGAPYRRWVEIGAGTHMVLLERNRRQAYDAIRAFLDEEYRPEGE